MSGASVLFFGACGSRSEISGLGSVVSDARFDAGSVVTLPPSGACATDTECATGAYCLVGTCDSDGGCGSGPRNCDDGISCTRDTCSESAKSCVHAPDDSLCPDAQLCSPHRDCDAFVYGVGVENHLYETRVPSGETFDVGLPAAPITDVALTGSVLYATDSYILYRLDRATAADTIVASILPLHQYNGLGAAPDGTLLATADVSSVFRVDPVTGASTPVTALPAGYRASGDVTTSVIRALVPLSSLNDLTAVSLAAFPATGPVTAAPVVLGSWSDACLYGIATLGGVVYALDCEGAIFTVDPRTGASSPVGKSTVGFLGAGGR